MPGWLSPLPFWLEFGEGAGRVGTLTLVRVQAAAPRDLTLPAWYSLTSYTVTVSVPLPLIELKLSSPA